MVYLIGCITNNRYSNKLEKMKQKYTDVKHQLDQVCNI